MTKTLNFDLINIDSIKTKVCHGLIGYAVNPEQHIGLSTLWLYLADGDVLKIHSTMTDTKDWDEVGTLVFQLLGNDEDVPQMMRLPQQWLSIAHVQKLVVTTEDFVAESGLLICNDSNEALTVVCSANVYRIELQAPFFSGSFQPEYEMAHYIHIPL